MAKGSTADSESKSKDEDRIEDNIGNSTDQYGEHTGFGKSLSCDKRVHSKCELYKKRSDSVNVHIGNSIFNRVLTCSKRKQESPVSNQKHDSKDRRYDEL